MSDPLSYEPVVWEITMPGKPTQQFIPYSYCKHLQEENERLKAEVQRLEGNIFGWKGTVMGQDSRLKCRDEEIELLKADLERRTTQYNSIIDQQLDTINDLKAKVEHIDLLKSVVEKFFNSADLKNPLDTQSHCAIIEKLKQLPDCILDFTEEQVRDNPAWALAVFRHKVKEMQYKRVHDLNAIGGEQEEVARLKAEVETIQKEFKRSLENMDWKPISTYRGGNWAYLFVPLDNIPGNYIIVEGCFMVGLKKWWVRSWHDTDRDADIKPTHWMPLFVPPEVGD